MRGADVPGALTSLAAHVTVFDRLFVHGFQCSEQDLLDNRARKGPLPLDQPQHAAQTRSAGRLAERSLRSTRRLFFGRPPLRPATSGRTAFVRGPGGARLGRRNTQRRISRAQIVESPETDQFIIIASLLGAA